MNTKQTKDAVRESLKYSILDGGAYAAMMGLTSSFITPLALELKASTFQVSLLSSAPALMTSISQLAAPDLAERAGSRKTFILSAVFLHAMMFIPILLIPYIFHVSAVWWLIGFVTISTVLGAVCNPAWGSMMADLVPMQLRGRYFGYRGRIAETITLVFTFIAGGILSFFKGSIFAGYALLFSGAVVFRLLSFFFLSRMYEPKQAVNKEKGPNLLEMIRKIGSSNLG
jgi:MFS family permease